MGPEGLKDDLIDQLIKPPRVLHQGFDWKRTDKLRPTGDAQRDRLVGERLGRCSS